jgi:hypothetical protein
VLGDRALDFAGLALDIRGLGRERGIGVRDPLGALAPGTPHAREGDLHDRQRRARRRDRRTTWRRDRLEPADQRHRKRGIDLPGGGAGGRSRSRRRVACAASPASRSGAARRARVVGAGRQGGEPAGQGGLQLGGERDALLELAGVLAAGAADRGVELRAPPVQIGERAGQLIERGLAQLDLGLGILGGLGRGLGLVAGGAGGLELDPGRGLAIGRERLGGRERRVVDQQQLAERAEMFAPGGDRRSGIRHGRRALRAEPRPLVVALAIARCDRRELDRDAIDLGAGAGEPLGRGGDHVVECAAIPPGMLGRAAQGARLAGDQLGPCVLVAGRAPQVVDQARLLGPYGLRGSLRLAQPRRQGGIIGG